MIFVLFYFGLELLSDGNAMEDDQIFNNSIKSVEGYINQLLFMLCNLKYVVNVYRYKCMMYLTNGQLNRHNC